jgi:hypothetical protein
MHKFITFDIELQFKNDASSNENGSSNKSFDILANVPPLHCLKLKSPPPHIQENILNYRTRELCLDVSTSKFTLACLEKLASQNVNTTILRSLVIRGEITKAMQLFRFDSIRYLEHLTIHTTESFDIFDLPSELQCLYLFVNGHVDVSEPLKKLRKLYLNCKTVSHRTIKNLTENNSKHSSYSVLIPETFSPMYSPCQSLSTIFRHVMKGSLVIICLSKHHFVDVTDLRCSSFDAMVTVSPNIVHSNKDNQKNVCTLKSLTCRGAALSLFHGMTSTSHTIFDKHLEQLTLHDNATNGIWMLKIRSKSMDGNYNFCQLRVLHLGPYIVSSLSNMLHLHTLTFDYNGHLPEIRNAPALRRIQVTVLSSSMI